MSKAPQDVNRPHTQLLQVSSLNPGSHGPRLNSFATQSGVNASESDYISTIEAHAKTSIVDSFYCGEQFADLSQFLTSHLNSHTNRHSSDLDPSAFFYKLSNKTTLSVNPLRTPSSLDAADSVVDPETPHNSLLFLCGYPSADWIAHVGSKYRVDPEFWHRHAGYLDSDGLTQLETKFVLPSASSSIIHLPLVSVASHKIVDGVATQEVVARHRRDCALAMADYRYRLRIGLKWKAGDSVVRDFETLDGDHFIIEQLATIFVTSRDEKKNSWIAIIWLDVGRDLAKSPPGPWLGVTSTTAVPSQLDLHKFFHPVVQYRPGIALKAHRCVLPPSSSQSSNSGLAHETSGLAQTSSLIAQFYGRSLNTTVMSTDPFYAIGEIFNFVAASEVTLLKLIAGKIDKAVKDASEVDNETTISPEADLVFYRRLLERRTRETIRTLSYIRNRHSLIWTTATSDSVSQSKSNSAALRLERDFGYILEVADDLRLVCDREITVMVNAASIAEAKRSIEQGKTLFRFTWLASIFVPLSFTASLFGMNVRELENGMKSIWLWVVITVPIFLCSVVFLFWNKVLVKGLVNRFIRLFVL